MEDAEWSDVVAAFERAETEMVEGYMDGFDVEAPAASFNRSRSYLHGFKNGRADRRGKPAWPSVDEARRRAAEAMAIDAGAACPYPLA